MAVMEHLTAEMAHFAADMQRRLVLRSLAAWPRRGRALLDVNCGDGAFLPLLGDCGFDLTATEADHEARRHAARAPLCVEILAAQASHLPWGADAFDYVVLHLDHVGADAVEDMVAEAFRVAAAGLAVTFWNAASLPLLGRGRRFRPFAVSWWRVWRAMKRLRGGSLSGASVLAGPCRTWRAESRFSRCNGVLPWPPLGAWALLRLDLAPGRPVTPLPLPLSLRAHPMSGPEPVLECGRNADARTARS